jgi:O-antigen ligase
MNGSAGERAVLAAFAAMLIVLPFASSVALRNGFLALGAIGLAIVLVRRREVPSMPREMWWILAAACAWAAWCIASTAWSIDRTYSAGELRPELLPPLLAFLCFFIVTRDSSRLRLWAWCIAVTTGGLAMSAILTEAVFPDGVRRPFHGDHASISTHLALGLPVDAWLFFTTASRAQRAGLLAIGVAAAIAGVLSANRMLWISIAAASIVGLAFGASSWRIPSRRGLLLAVVAVGICVAGLAGTIERKSLELAQQHGELPAISADDRLAIWRLGAERAKESPWLGYGFGRGILRQEFRYAVSQDQPNALHWHGHNVFLDVVLQLGLVGLAIFVLLWGSVAVRYFRATRSTPEGRMLGALGLALFAAFILKNTTDDVFVRHTALLWWALTGAILGVLARNAQARPGG